MPQSLAKVYLHTIFSTKGRHPYFGDPSLRTALHSYLAGVAKAQGCLPVAVGGVADHVHLLTTLSRTVTIADFVKEVKRVSTLWVQTRGGILAKFHWQSGYGTFSVSQSEVDRVARYIADQEDHHHKKSFQDEFRTFLHKHGIPFDESYVWD